ncbi:MAG: uroporphyrinogen decarboxylase family protein [Armatimonadota bacterium]
MDKVEGILLLDDIVGMLSPNDYEEFAHPYLQRIFSAFPDCIRAYHNDNPGYSFYDRLSDAGAEVLNFSHLDDISVLDNAIGDRMCLMGNLAPLEMLVNGTPEEVYNTSKKIISSVKHAFLLSAGGGASTGTKPKNIDAMVEAVKSVLN